MKTISTLLLLILLPSFGCAASSDEALIALRFETLKTAMNARDFDLAQYRIRQIEILRSACDRETKRNQIPISCFELRESQLKVNLAAHRAIFDIQSEQDLDLQCQNAVEASSDLASETYRDHSSRLSRGCRTLFDKKVAVLVYKKTGKRIE